MIDQAAARAFVEVLMNDKVFGKTIQMIFDTLKLDLAANTAVDALLDRMSGDKENYIPNFRAALAIAFTAGSFYAMESRNKESQQPKDIN